MNFPSIFEIENWFWKYNFGTFWRTVIHRRIVLKQFSLSMLILGQKSCILGTTTFKIPQPNWDYNTYQCCNLEFGVSTSSYEDWLARTNRPGPTYGSWEKQHKLGGGVSNSVSQIPTLIQQSYLCRLLTICRAVGECRGRWEFVPSDFGRNRSKTLWIQTCTNLMPL